MRILRGLDWPAFAVVLIATLLVAVCARRVFPADRYDCEIAVQAAILRQQSIVPLPDSLGDVKPLRPQPRPDGTPLSDVAITVGTPNNIVAGLSEVLGPRGSLLFMPAKPIVLKRDEATVTLNNGTLIDYTQQADGRMLLSFPKPRKLDPITTGEKPTVSVNVWRLKISPPINSIELTPNDKATFDVGSGLTHRRPTFDLRLDDEPKKSATSPDVPVILCYTMDGCPPCARAKRELIGMPFRVEWCKSDPPFPVNGLPCFWWHPSGRDPRNEPRSETRKIEGYESKQDILNRWNLSRKYIQRTTKRWDISPHSRQRYIEHLLTDGIHRGKFRREILDRMSNEELLALHSDDHEGCVDWSALRAGGRQ